MTARPCGICGSKVRETTVMEREFASTEVSYEIERECLNPECGSNARDNSLVDTV